MVYAPKSPHMKRTPRRGPVGSFISKPVRKVAESRGFAHGRLLTEWADVVGPDIARLATPVKVGYGSRMMGATLEVSVRPGAAPEVQMQERLICERVNTCYGYNAIRKLRIVAGSGPRPQPAPKPKPAPPRLTKEVQDTLADVKDPTLRAALEGLGSAIHAKSNASQEQS